MYGNFQSISLFLMLKNMGNNSTYLEKKGYIKQYENYLCNPFHFSP